MESAERNQESGWRAPESTPSDSSKTPPTQPAGSCSADGCLSIRYRVEDADGTFLDQFSTNAPDVATERISHIREYHPGLTVTETPDND